MAEQYYVSKKYHEISMLAGETAGQMSKNGEEWTKYLTTAARLYRYSFEDQMLIYAQRPDASACATMETWNEKMFCWVNREGWGKTRTCGRSGRNIRTLCLHSLKRHTAQPIRIIPLRAGS